MPCNSDYLRASESESERNKAGRLFVFALNRLGRPVPDHIQRAAIDVYGRSKEGCDIVVELCSLLRSLGAAGRSSLFDSPCSPVERAELRLWWERHAEEDAKREKREAEEREVSRLRSQALAKLTPEEREALGIVEEAPNA